MTFRARLRDALARGNSVFTIVAEIRPGEVEQLGKLLDEIGDDIKGNPHLRFSDLKGLHYASFVIIECPQPHLLFEGNIDGPVTAFLEQLVRAAGETVDRIWSHCVDFPAGDPPRAVGFLGSRDIGADAFYIAWPGRTVQEICAEQELRNRLGEVIDREFAPPRSPPPTPEEIRARLQQVVGDDPSLAWAVGAPVSPFLVRNGRRVALAVIAPVALVLARTAKTAVLGRPGPARSTARLALFGVGALVGGGAAGLRRQERADDRRDAARDPGWETVYGQWSGNLAGIVQRENVQGQNHLASVTRVQPGRFRLGLLRAVLLAVNLLATLSANRGSLGGITTIHFARWAITPDGKSVVFLSNFDGSWERYLNDFIDLAAVGLTAVWTNTTNEVGFPSTRWLVLEGAKDEQRFKSYARYSQARTRAWYSAYPDLSNENIANNRAIREQLFSPLDPPAVEAWLRRF